MWRLIHLGECIMSAFTELRSRRRVTLRSVAAVLGLVLMIGGKFEVCMASAKMETERRTWQARQQNVSFRTLCQ